MSTDNGNGIKERLRLAEREIAEMKEKIVEHRVRLENGGKTMRDTEKRISHLEHTTAPKAVSPLKIVGITLTVMVTCTGALWGLANMLRDRPTMDDVEKMIERHSTRASHERR